MLPMCISYYEYCVIFLCLDVILLSSTLSIEPIGSLILSYKQLISILKIQHSAKLCPYKFFELSVFLNVYHYQITFGWRLTCNSYSLYSCFPLFSVALNAFTRYRDIVGATSCGSYMQLLYDGQWGQWTFYKNDILYSS